MSAEATSVPSGYGGMVLNGTTILYVSATIISAILVAFAALFFWRWRRTRRRRAMGLDPWTGRPSVIIPPHRPEFYDVWLDAPSSECGWGDIKPFSLEKIESMTHQCKMEKSKSRASRLFSRPRENKSSSTLGSSVDELSINEKTIPPSLQLSVFIAMPSPKSDEGEHENQMAVGLVTVPYHGQT